MEMFGLISPKRGDRFWAPMRLSIIVVVTLLSCIASSAQDRQPPPHVAPAMAPKGRNVLLIVFDDTGAEMLNGFVKGSSTA